MLRASQIRSRDEQMPAKGSPDASVLTEIQSLSPDQFDHVRHKAVFIFAAPWSPSLRGSVLSKYATNTTFRQIQFAAHIINADTATRGA